ncbi:MAG: hypothetical protein VYB44_17665 [Bacteroidota bacterium]|nr:hypothetical protein [Bacteroidota bacterium]
MIREIENKVEIRAILDVISGIAFSLELPERMVKSANWDERFFRSYDLFSENFYPLIQELIFRQESKIYLVDADFESPHKLLEIESSTSYQEFFSVLHDELNLPSICNLLFFDRNGEWLVYADTFYDLLVASFSKPLYKSEAVKSHYLLNKEGLKSYLKEMASPRDIDGFVSKIASNYPSAFNQ